ncbi:MAG: DUF2752 domain-containing protein [Acidimicrobiales bacterium]
MTYVVTRSNSTARWLPLVGVGAALGALTVLDGPVLCPFRRCTGGYCPICGATRSVAALARLDPVGALRLYPALPVLALAAALAAWPQRFGGVHHDRWLLGAAVAIAAIWLVRLAVGDIPAPTGLYAPFG